MDNKELVPEYLLEKVVWQDYIETLQEVFDANLSAPIGALERIRNLDQTSEPELLLRTMRMLGFDVTHDFVTLNQDKILRLTYMFAQFYQNNFNDKFTDFVSFVLGRKVRTDNLYTRDYLSFYQKPFGALNVDGGDWYKTTHINVSVNLEPSSLKDGQVILAPDQTIQDRIIDLFYEYCPLTLVVNNFFFASEFQARYYMSGALYVGAQSTAVGGPGLAGGRDISDLVAIEIDGPGLVYEEGVYQYRLVLVWPAAYREPWPFTQFAVGDYLKNLGFGRIAVGTIPQDEETYVSASFAGKSALKTVTLKDRGDTTIVKSLTIEGPSQLPENCIQQYNAVLTWDSGYRLVCGATVSLAWGSSVPAVAEFVTTAVDALGAQTTVLNSGTLTVRQVAHAGVSQDVVLTASFTNIDGSAVSDKRTVRIVNTQADKYVKYIVAYQNPAALPPQTHRDLPPAVNHLDENQTYTYYCEARYSDGSSERIYPFWRLRTDAATIDTDGTLRVGLTPHTYTTTLDAEYEHGGDTFRTRVPLTFRARPRYVDDQAGGTEFGTALKIVGPQLVLQNSSAYFALMVKWIDQDDYVQVQPDEWATDKFSITRDGLFRAGAADEGGEVVTLQASFFFQGGEYATTLRLNVVRQPPQIEFIDISGTQSMERSARYRCYAYWSDRSRSLLASTLTSTLTWSVDEPFAEVSLDGELRLTAPHTKSFVTLRAAYTADGAAYTASLYVAVYQPADVIKGIRIEGPDDLVEFDIQRYTCWAMFTDPATPEAMVTPQWTVENMDVNVDQVALVNSNGDVNVLRNDVPTSVKLTAQYYAQTAFKVISVSVFSSAGDDPPSLAWIEGPDLAPATLLPAVYTLWVKYDADPTPIAFGADWSLDVDPAVAEIDANGVLTVHKFDDRVVEVTATRSVGYSAPVVASKKVRVPADNAVGALTVTGPTSVYERETIQYRAFAGGVEVTADAGIQWRLESMTYPEPIVLGPTGVLTVNELTHPAVALRLRAVYYHGTVDVGGLVVKATRTPPRYGAGGYGVATFAAADAVCVDPMPSAHSLEQFALACDARQFGYFLAPIELGPVVFHDAATGAPVPWNGAKWAQNATSCADPDPAGPSCGPLVVDGDGRQFRLYRTNAPGLSLTFVVKYQNL